VVEEEMKYRILLEMELPKGSKPMEWDIEDLLDSITGKGAKILAGREAWLLMTHAEWHEMSRFKTKKYPASDRKII
jgi:hypothetical protein